MVTADDDRGDVLDALRHTDHPFFAPRWRPNEIGLILGQATDWDAVTELLTDSYGAAAPQRLAKPVPRPQQVDAGGPP